MIRTQRAAFTSVLACPGLCLCKSPVRNRSTKSAIHAALQKTEHPDHRSPRWALEKPRRRLSAAQGDSRLSYREKLRSRIVEGVEKRQLDSYTSRAHSRLRNSTQRTGYHKNSSFLGYQDGGINTFPVRKAQRPRRGPHSNQEKVDSHFPREQNNLFAESDGRHAGSSLSSFLSEDEQEISKAAGAVATKRRLRLQGEGQSGLRRPAELDFAKTHTEDFRDAEPLMLSYTTPASEFLYGHSVVTTALRARRRKFYKLYIYQSPKRLDERKDMEVRKMALDRGVLVEKVPPNGLRILDRMSDGRPHNGFILEASPLPKLPVTGFDRLTQPGEEFLAFLDHQTLEDKEVNGTDPRIRYSSPYPRFPFVLLLDGILDPGNLGAILRTAFFLGVDAVALTTNRSAPLSPVALKASAGASEAMPIVTINQTRQFLDQCKGNGWKVYASDANPPGTHQRKLRHLTTSTLVSDVFNRPCILILGSEGQGLYKDVQGAADNTISIKGPRQGEMGVDSLNVSVAAGLLCEAFLRKPAKVDVQARYYKETEDMDLRIRNRLF